MRHIFIVFLLSIGINAFAQTPKIEKSEGIDEPGAGWNKILLLKNDNTFFFHVSKKDGIEVTVYGKDRKVASTKSIESEKLELRKMKNIHIASLCEINNEAVLFVVQYEGRVSTLYRLRFNGTNGDIIKEEDLGTVPTVRFVAYHSEGTDIYVEKDPESDCYAVIYFNGKASDRSERIKVEHYDGTHKRINVAYYDSPDENFKYLRFIGAVVDANKRVFIATYGAASLKGKEGHVFISRLNSTDSVFTNKMLDFTEDFKDTKSVMAYNHNNNIIQLLTLSFVTGRLSFFRNGARGMYSSFLSYIDPESLSLKLVAPLMGSKINEYGQKTLELNGTYRGLPQQMVINKDNSTTVLSEDLTQELVLTQTGEVMQASTFLAPLVLMRSTRMEPKRTARY